MRRIIVPTVLALALLAASCGNDGGTGDPASLGTCEEVADAAIDVLQQTIDVVDGLSDEDPASSDEPGEASDEFRAIEEAGMALEARALDLGCTDEQMSALMRERAGTLSAESAIGQLVIEGLREGGEGFFE